MSEQICVIKNVFYFNTLLSGRLWTKAAQDLYMKRTVVQNCSK